MSVYLPRQDFRGISSFQPLTLTVEHIIKPISLPKPSLLIPEVQLPQIGHNLGRALEPPWSFCQPETAYQQQMDVPTSQLPTQPPCLASTAPTCYAPQIGEQRVPTATSSKILPLTYGVCVKGTDHVKKKDPQSTQKLKEASPDSFDGGKLITQTQGESCSHWNYKEQWANVALWHSSDTREAVLSQGSPGHTQRLLLPRDGTESQVPGSQLSLSLLEQAGCYRGQRADLPLLLSSVKVDADYVPADEPLSSLSVALLFPGSTGNTCPGEYSTEPGMFSGTHGSEMLTETKELSCSELSNGVFQDTASDWDNGTPLALLFKDLNLKVLWDQEENTECY